MHIQFDFSIDILNFSTMDPEDEMDPEAAQEVVAAWDQDSAVNLADLV